MPRFGGGSAGSATGSAKLGVCVSNSGSPGKHATAKPCGQARIWATTEDPSSMTRVIPATASYWSLTIVDAGGGGVGVGVGVGGAEELLDAPVLMP